MTCEILSAKLYEMDGAFERLRYRIRKSQTAEHEELEAEIESLKEECDESQRLLYRKLSRSRAYEAGRLLVCYEQIQKLIKEEKGKIEYSAREDVNADVRAERMLLDAEYVLDFAIQAANHALLFSMEALEAQLTCREEKEG